MRTRGLVLLACLLLPGTLLAHAHLESADPADGAELAEVPAQFELRYSEGIEARFSAFDLYSVPSSETTDVDGQPRVALADPEVDAAERTVTLRPETRLEPGTYILVWEVLAHDGHTTSGEIRFSVLE